MSADRERPGAAGADRSELDLVRGAIVLAAFALLLGLGVWQLKRLQWKTDLLHRIELLKAAPPRTLDAALRDGLYDYVRVQADCPEVERTPSLRLYALRDGAAGYRLITACPLRGSPYGSVLVDRGFLPTEATAAPGAPLAGPVTGVLRRPELRTFVTPPNELKANLWYWRDIPGMASALHAARPAPAMLMLESPAPQGDWPKPAPLPASISNNHLQYAITWFGLAAALAGVYLAFLLRRRSGRRAPTQ